MIATQHFVILPERKTLRKMIILVRYIFSMASYGVERTRRNLRNMNEKSVIEPLYLFSEVAKGTEACETDENF